MSSTALDLGSTAPCEDAATAGCSCPEDERLCPVTCGLCEELSGELELRYPTAAMGALLRVDVTVVPGGPRYTLSGCRCLDHWECARPPGTQSSVLSWPTSCHIWDTRLNR